MSTRNDLLKPYREKRDFDRTPEPEGTAKPPGGDLYVVQKHDARRLHYDLRLELDGVLKSWAVAKGPSLDPSDKRLAVRTEDHPVDYGNFEGVIPEGYGAGAVLLWDRGRWRPKGDPHQALGKGVLRFILQGERLKGGFALVRMKPKPGEKRENWLLVKERDSEAVEGFSPTGAWPDSVRSGRGLQEVARGADAAPQDPNRRAGGKRATAAAPKNGRKAAAARPAFVPPQLATLRDSPPRSAAWLHEVKFDGYRIQALIHDGVARLVTRNNQNWTARYPELAEALRAAVNGDAIIDGELVAFDGDGRGDFGLLQNAHRNRDIKLRYYAFDLLYAGGEDLRTAPLLARKKRLRSLLPKRAPRVLYSDHVKGDGERIYERACGLGMEGIVSKRADAPYRSGRNRDWIKSKCVGNDEFVIAGYRKSDKRGRPFASLRLGEFVGDDLVYRGRVGAGFDTASLARLSSQLQALERATSPYALTPGEAKKDAVWVTPKLVAQIAYSERTAEGRLRHPVFAGLREDKPARAVRAPDAPNGEAVVVLHGVRLTNPGRILFPQQGATKRAVAEYYARHADWLLPFVKNRPLSIVRCPNGRDDACFFQKHHKASAPQHLSKINIEEKRGKRADYIVVRSAKGMVALAQIAALELHVWGARADRVDHPERLVFDLDPDDRIPFKAVRDSARELRDVLSAAGLRSFPLLTGGKGIHVVVPLQRRRDWSDIKFFARGLARLLAQAAPGRYVSEASKAKRQGRIFIDWLRNGRGATAVAPYSLRARENAPIATPVSWRELSRFESAASFNIGNIAARLDRLKNDPWEGYHGVRQSITDAHLAHAARAG